MAVLHHHTLRVGLVGLGIIVSYQLLFTGFRTGPGIKGLIDHLGHEWVTLTNLLLLLVGFALLVAPFRKEPCADHAASLPARRLERRLRPAGDDLRTFVLPRQHCSSTDRRCDGASAVSRQGAHRISRRHRRGIECRWRRQRYRRYHDHHDVDQWRVAAQRARGLHWSWYCAGDIRDTRGNPAAPLFADAERRSPGRAHRLEACWHRWPDSGRGTCHERCGQHAVRRERGPLPLYRCGCLVRHPRFGPVLPSGLGTRTRGLQRHRLPAVAGDSGILDAGRVAARCFLGRSARSGLRVLSLRQYPAHGACTETGRLRLGLPRLCCWLRWVDGMVRFVGWRGLVESLS